ncbi:unnamed protein product [Amoebophrya sp. A25]|nr:unnamed protein product [Amoebophrya sp. A25]|eukprot:GSA25T00011643001.1
MIQPLLTGDHPDGIEGDSKPTNNLLFLYLSYIVLGGLMLVNYFVVGQWLNKTYPRGNRVNPHQTGAFNLWGSIYDQQHFVLYYTYLFGFLCATTGFILNMVYVFRVARIMPASLYYRLCGSLTAFMVLEHIWMPLCCVYIAAPQEYAWVRALISVLLKVAAAMCILWAYYTYHIPKDLSVYGSIWTGGDWGALTAKPVAASGEDEEEQQQLAASNSTVSSRTTITRATTRTTARESATEDAEAVQAFDPATMIASKRRIGDITRMLGVVGSYMMACHCTVLDGCIWSFYFDSSNGRFPPLKALNRAGEYRSPFD